MKLLHVISSLETGGAQKLVGDLLPVINSQPDIETRLIVFRKTGSPIEKTIIDKGIEIVSLECSPKSPGALLKLLPHLRWADVVHAHLFPINYQMAIANILAGKPLVFTEHSTHNRRRDKKWLRPAEKWMYSRYAAVGCISKAVNDNLRKWIGQKTAGEKLHTIENGVDLSSFKDIQSISKEKLFGREGTAVLMISRFVDAKDQPTLIKSIAKIDDKDVFAVLVGDGPRREEFEQLARDLGISDRVLFLGTRSDIPDIIGASDIGVQSSNWEGFGLTAVEMMAGGLPVIASDVEGLKQVVEDAGLLFPKGDDDLLAEAILSLLKNKDLYSLTSQSCRKKASAYSIERTAEVYIRLYRDLLNTI